jgi:hypothetical protein
MSRLGFNHTRISYLLRTRFTAAFGAIVFLVGLTSCTAMKVKLGWKVYLAQTPVASVDAKLPKGPGIAPGFCRGLGAPVEPVDRLLQVR